MPGSLDIIYRCVQTWYYLGQNCQLTFYFRSKPGAPSATIPAEMASIHSDMETRHQLSLKGMMTNQAQLVASVLVNLNGPSPYEDIRTYTTTFGTVAGSGLPSMCAGVIGWFTQFRGKRLHGRSYIPCVPISFVTGNDLNATGLSAYQALINGAVARFGLTGTSPDAWQVVYSKKNGASINPGPPPHYDYLPEAGVMIVRGTIDLRIGTQRHRLEGRGI